MQLDLGPPPERVLGEARFFRASRRNDNPIDGAGFADGVAGIDRPAGGVRDVGGAIEQPRETVVRLRDRVAHPGAPRDVDRLVVDENPHQRPAGAAPPWKRTSFGASTGVRRVPKYRVSASISTTSRSSRGAPASIRNPEPPVAIKSLTTSV